MRVDEQDHRRRLVVHTGRGDEVVDRVKNHDRRAGAALDRLGRRERYRLLRRLEADRPGRLTDVGAGQVERGARAAHSVRLHRRTSSTAVSQLCRPDSKADSGAGRSAGRPAPAHSSVVVVACPAIRKKTQFARTSRARLDVGQMGGRPPPCYRCPSRAARRTSSKLASDRKVRPTWTVGESSSPPLASRTIALAASPLAKSTVA